LLYWEVAYTSDFRTWVHLPTGPGYYVPLVPSSRRPCLWHASVLILSQSMTVVLCYKTTVLL